MSWTKDLISVTLGKWLSSALPAHPAIRTAGKLPEITFTRALIFKYSPGEIGVCPYSAKAVCPRVSTVPDNR
jgi:hypothetical protein